MSAQPTHELESAAARHQSTLDVDDKGNLDHVEDEDDLAKKPAAFVVDNYGELSKQHDLSFRATLVQFRKAMAICFGVGICAMGDGYQYKMPGNIVALPGFIRQMGYQNADGKWMLDPQHVAAWGGESDSLLPFINLTNRCLRCLCCLYSLGRLVSDRPVWSKAHVDRYSSLYAYRLFDRDVRYQLDSLDRGQGVERE